MTVWRRVNRDTIEWASAEHGRWQIRVVGENASGKPIMWGLYRAIGSLWFELRGAVSKHPRLRKMNPNGTHITFNKQSAAKRYVEHKLQETP